MPRHLRFVLPALVATGLALAGCGDTRSETPAAAATPIVTPTPAPAVKAAPATPAKARKSGGRPVAPEVVVPSTTDIRVQQAYVGWQGLVLDGLRKVDAHLVTNEADTLRKVRATCTQMSTGMFETKVVPIIMNRFSNAKLTVTHDMAEDIYSVILEDACYKMAEAPPPSSGAGP